MRVNYVLLAAAVVLVGAIDASVATVDTVAKIGIENPAEEDERDDDSEEERGLGDTYQLTKLAAKFYGKSPDEVGEIIKGLEKDKIELIFDKGGYVLSSHLPGFQTGMSGRAFGNLIKDLPLDQQAPLFSAYSKYLAIKGLL